MQHDAFPATLNTWIGQKLQEGLRGRAELNHHIMSVYRDPLMVYFRGCSDRWLGEPEDIVDGFFADRLDRKEFFLDWQKSKKRLRRWLMNALCFYLMERRRGRRRDAGIAELPDDLPSFSGNPEQEVDRAFAYSILQRALERTRQACVSQSLEAHWEVFQAHHVQGLPYTECARVHDVDLTRARRMARTVRDKYRDSLRDMLADDLDGASPDQIDQELETLASILTP